MSDDILECPECETEMESEQWENGLHIYCPECEVSQVP